MGTLLSTLARNSFRLLLDLRFSISAWKLKNLLQQYSAYLYILTFIIKIFFNRIWEWCDELHRVLWHKPNHACLYVCATKLSHLLLSPCNFSKCARTFNYNKCKATLAWAICHSRWVGKIVLVWHATCVQIVLNNVIKVKCARNKTNFHNLTRYM